MADLVTRMAVSDDPSKVTPREDRLYALLLPSTLIDLAYALRAPSLPHQPPCSHDLDCRFVPNVVHVVSSTPAHEDGWVSSPRLRHTPAAALPRFALE